MVGESTHRYPQVQLCLDRKSRDHGEVTARWLAAALDQVVPELAVELERQNDVSIQNRRPDELRAHLNYWNSDETVDVGVPYSTETRNGLPLVLRQELKGVGLDVSRINADGITAKFGAAVSTHWFGGPWPSQLGQAYYNETIPQERLVAFLRSMAERCNPTFGSIGWHQMEEMTSFERCRWLYPAHTVPMSRDLLRGYSWVTVIAKEQGDYLGGADRLRLSGAFSTVDELTGGGYWLQATPRWSDYGSEAAEAVFSVVAPLLPPGRPPYVGDNTDPVVDRDPRTVPFPKTA